MRSKILHALTLPIYNVTHHPCSFAYTNIHIAIYSSMTSNEFLSPSITKVSNDSFTYLTNESIPHLISNGKLCNYILYPLRFLILQLVNLFIWS